MRATGRRPLDEALEARTRGDTRFPGRLPVIDPSAPISPAQQSARLDALERAVREHSDLVPEVGAILGSGLGGLADELTDAVSIPFADLPGWPDRTSAR